MRLIDGDAVKERFKNDISGMEERKEKGKDMFEKMEIMSQLSFARYAYAVSIKEPTVPAIPMERIKRLRAELNITERIYVWEIDKETVELDEVLELIDKMIKETEV